MCLKCLDYILWSYCAFTAGASSQMCIRDRYYRIQVIPLTIPPMRNRREDIIPLCLHFLHYFCQKYNIQKSFSDIVLKEVQEYDWPDVYKRQTLRCMTQNWRFGVSSIPMIDVYKRQVEYPACLLW